VKIGEESYLGAVEIITHFVNWALSQGTRCFTSRHSSKTCYKNLVRLRTSSEGESVEVGFGEGRPLP